MVSGSFTEWKYKKMMKLVDFLRIIDKTDVSVFVKQLRERGRCRWDAKVYGDLNEAERGRLAELIEEHHRKRRR